MTRDHSERRIPIRLYDKLAGGVRLVRCYGFTSRYNSRLQFLHVHESESRESERSETRAHCPLARAEIQRPDKVSGQRSGARTTSALRSDFCFVSVFFQFVNRAIVKCTLSLLGGSTIQSSDPFGRLVDWYMASPNRITVHPESLILFYEIPYST